MSFLNLSKCWEIKIIVVMTSFFTKGRFFVVEVLLKYIHVRPKMVHHKTYNNLKHGPMNYPLLAGLLMSWRSPTKDTKPVKSSMASTLMCADDLFENGHYEECYQYLKNAEEATDAEVKWRICRAMYNMAKDSKYEKNFKNELISEAYIIISEILEENYENYAVQKWYALLLDAKSTQIGIKERILQLENVKKHMDVNVFFIRLAVTYNPNDATTLYMLGEWCYQVSDMPWHQRKIAEALFGSPPHSTYEDALEYFLRAESTQPRFYSLNLLRLGNCYLKLNKEDQAKYYLNLAASYPAKSNDDHKANKEATELLKRMK